MEKKQIRSILMAGIFLASFSASAQFGTVLLSDGFENESNNWELFSIDGSTGFVDLSNGALNIDLESGNAFGTYYSPTSFSGHFEVEVEFNKDHGVAMALIKSVNGQPSPNDYSMITIKENNNGIIEVKLTDKQSGQQDVLDLTGLAEKSRYTHLLTGEEYSIPYPETARKLRILRHENEQFLHFYYAVEKEIDGELFHDWMELAPSKEWGTASGAYFVGLFSLEGNAQFNNVEVRQLPTRDQEDINTGFTITNRPYTWSGYTDSAMVVTFGGECLFSKEDRKFVFWRLTNNVPSWHLNNYSLFSYGFVETWDGGNPGCHEPMSDRLLAFSDLEIVEDNEVRKVIKWSYELVNPDYKIPTNNEGEQFPEVSEYYFIYADGSIIRKIQYAPKLDTGFRNWHELTELMLIAGGNKRPGSLLEYPSLTFHELDKAPMQFNNASEKKYRNNNKRLGATTLIAHVKGAPELFISFSDDTSTPNTHTGLPLNYEVTWHDRKHNFGHWPIHKESYAEPFKSGSSWPEHIAHTSLIGMGIDQGQDWKDNFLVREDGRKYRQWLGLVGMSEKDGDTTPEDQTNSWLFPGIVKMVDNSSSFIQYSHQDKYFEFETKPEKPACHFTVVPKTKLINPIIRIKQWGKKSVKVNMGGKALDSSDYVASIDEDGNLLLLIMGAYTGTVKIEVYTTS